MGVGAQEWLVIVVVAMIVISPKDLPGVVRTVGRWYRKWVDFQRQLLREINMLDDDGKDDKSI